MSSDKQNAEEEIIHYWTNENEHHSSGNIGNVNKYEICTEKEPETHQINLPIDVTCSYDSADQCEDEINDNFSSFETVLELKQICNEINNIAKDSDLEEHEIDCLNDTLNVDQILTRIKKLESNLKSLSKCKKRNIKKIWKHFDDVNLESQQIVDTLLRKVDIVEHAIANSYQMYDSEMSKLRRRIVQLESDNVILQDRLKISNMLSQIRDNTSQTSSENSKTSSNYSPKKLIKHDTKKSEDFYFVRFEDSSKSDEDKSATAFTLSTKSSDKDGKAENNESEESNEIIKENSVLKFNESIEKYDTSVKVNQTNCDAETLKCRSTDDLLESETQYIMNILSQIQDIQDIEIQDIVEVTSKIMSFLSTFDTEQQSDRIESSNSINSSLSSDQSLERPAAVFTLGNKSSEEKYSEGKDNETEEEQQHKLETSKEQNQEEKEGNIFARFRNKIKQNKQVEQDTREEDGSDQKETKQSNMNENTQHDSNSDMSGDKQQENISKMSDDNQHEIQNNKSDDNKHESPGNKSDDKYQK